MFKTLLQIVGDVSQIVIPERIDFDPEMDNELSMMSKICDKLADAGCVEFVVVGFGQDRWPVDVRYDLPLFLDCLPSVIELLDSEQPASLDFPEQGIERYVAVEVSRGTATLTCTDSPFWSASPRMLQMSYKELRTELLNVWNVFAELVQRLFPEEVANEWYSARNSRMSSILHTAR